MAPRRKSEGRVGGVGTDGGAAVVTHGPPVPEVPFPQPAPIVLPSQDQTLPAQSPRGRAVEFAVVELFAFLRHVTSWAGICFVSLMTYLSIAQIAGKTTVFTAAMKLLADVRATETVLCIVLALMGIGTWKVQRRNKLLTKEVSRLSELEKKVDPRRTSSGLTEFGESPRGDPE